MFKAKKQLKSIYDTKFVSDISSEAAANCSGGADIDLFEDANLEGASVGYIAAPGLGVSDLEEFDNRVSSARINNGQWQFFFDNDFGGSSSPVFGPGDLPVVPLAADNQTSSIRRVG